MKLRHIFNEGHSIPAFIYRDHGEALRQVGGVMSGNYLWMDQLIRMLAVSRHPFWKGRRS